MKNWYRFNGRLKRKLGLWHSCSANFRSRCGKQFMIGDLRFCQRKMPDDLGRVCWNCRKPRKDK